MFNFIEGFPYVFRGSKFPSKVTEGNPPVGAKFVPKRVSELGVVEVSMTALLMSGGAVAPAAIPASAELKNTSHGNRLRFIGCDPPEIKLRELHQTTFGQLT